MCGKVADVDLVVVARTVRGSPHLPVRKALPAHVRQQTHQHHQRRSHPHTPDQESESKREVFFDGRTHSVWPLCPTRPLAHSPRTFPDLQAVHAQALSSVTPLFPAREERQPVPAPSAPPPILIQPSLSNRSPSSSSHSSLFLPQPERYNNGAGSCGGWFEDNPSRFLRMSTLRSVPLYPPPRTQLSRFSLPEDCFVSS